MERVKGRGGEKEEKYFSLLPLLPLLFLPSHLPLGLLSYFYSPQSSSVIKSKMAASSQRYDEQAFVHPKYACTAGYVFTHAASRSYKNSLIHATERKNDIKKGAINNNNDDDSNNLTLLFLSHLSIIQTTSYNNFDIHNLNSSMYKQNMLI